MAQAALEPMAQRLTPTRSSLAKHLFRQQEVGQMVGLHLHVIAVLRKPLEILQHTWNAEIRLPADLCKRFDI